MTIVISESSDQSWHGAMLHRIGHCWVNLIIFNTIITLRSRQHGHYFANDIFKFIF